MLSKSYDQKRREKRKHLRATTSLAKDEQLDGLSNRDLSDKFQGNAPVLQVSAPYTLFASSTVVFRSPPCHITRSCHVQLSQQERERKEPRFPDNNLRYIQKKVQFSRAKNRLCEAICNRKKFRPVSENSSTVESRQSISFSTFNKRSLSLSASEKGRGLSFCHPKQMVISLSCDATRRGRCQKELRTNSSSDFSYLCNEESKERAARMSSYTLFQDEDRRRVIFEGQNTSRSRMGNSPVDPTVSGTQEASTFSTTSAAKKCHRKDNRWGKREKSEFSLLLLLSDRHNRNVLLSEQQKDRRWKNAWQKEMHIFYECLWPELVTRDLLLKRKQEKRKPR